MPKYYSVCEVTPSHKKANKRYLRVYAHAPQGYLFHDTEGLDVDALRKPMFILSELYSDEAKAVVYIRVDANTIMATFNTSGIPTPSRIGGKEYLSEKRLKGWLQQNVRDPAGELSFIDYDEVYDRCTMLERFTSSCPCPKLEEGTCLPATIYAAYPWLAETQASYTNPEPTVYKRKRFQDVAGFKSVPGTYAIDSDFNESVRPWDNYDFGLVAARSEEFAERGIENARRALHRKVECSQCIFSTKKHAGTYADCGQIKACEGHATEEQAWTALRLWLAKTPYAEGCEGFSIKEIHYLIAMSGIDYLSRAVTPSRNTLTKLAGFRLRGDDLSYRVAPCQGNTTRRASFGSYVALREVFTLLPESKDIPEVKVYEKQILAHAIFSTWGYIRPENGHQPHPVYSITVSHDAIQLTGTTTRGTFGAYYLGGTSNVMEYFGKLWPHSYHRVHTFIGNPGGLVAGSTYNY